MKLAGIDWGIIVAFFVVTMVIGVWASRKAGRSAKDFFLSGRDMPWWLLGISMVATTFSADTPNLVTDIVRKDGIAGNWVWWAMLVTGMVTVFIYAKLWRRSGITTDLEFYELRYSGAPARFLRAFRALYLGVLANVLIMATVLLAGIKLGAIVLGLDAVTVVLIVSTITVVYSALGGLRGVILTDFFQFILSMIGLIAGAIYIINMPEVGGLDAVLSNPNVAPKLDLIPDLNNLEVAIPLFFIPLAVQWWSTWYPGAEPGGGGYIAQRMLSAKTESDATKATLLFNIAHYALRPWPWILIALASIVLFPDLSDIQMVFPSISNDILKDDIAFPAMISMLPSGLLGLLIASLFAALMSTLSTHLNWGSSYFVHDFYARFIDTTASPRKQVMVGRLSTVALMVMASVFALFLSNAKQAFDIILQMGAGTGLLFLLRWFWWRINAYSEIVAMIVSLILAILLNVTWKDHFPSHVNLLIGVAGSTLAWVLATALTRPTDRSILRAFYQKIRPHRSGWQPIARDHTAVDNSKSTFGTELLMVIMGCIMIYAGLLGMGYLLFGNYIATGISLVVVLVASVIMFRNWSAVMR